MGPDDANDFATFAVTAMPFGLYFLHAGRGTLARVLAAVALAILTLAFVRTGSRGGFVALVAVTGFVVLRDTAIALRWRIAATALGTVVVLTASLIGFVVGAFFLSLAYSQILYTLVALAVGLQKVTVGSAGHRD